MFMRLMRSVSAALIWAHTWSRLRDVSLDKGVHIETCTRHLAIQGRSVFHEDDGSLIRNFRHLVHRSSKYGPASHARSTMNTRRTLSAKRSKLDASSHKITHQLSSKTNKTSPSATVDSSQMVCSEPPVLSINPTSLEDLDIMFATAADLPSWEPNDVTSLHPPTEKNDSAYLEMPKWRRDSADQYFSSHGLALLRKRYASEMSRRTAENDDAEAELETCQNAMAHQQQQIDSLVKIHKLPFRRMALKRLDRDLWHQKTREELFWARREC